MHRQSNLCEVLNDFVHATIQVLFKWIDITQCKNLLTTMHSLSDVRQATFQALCNSSLPKLSCCAMCIYSSPRANMTVYYNVAIASMISS